MPRRPPALLAALLGLVLALAGTACRFQGDEPPPPDPDVFCEDHAVIRSNFASLPNRILEELQGSTAQLAEDAEGLAGRAPDEVADAAATLADGLRQASDAVAAAPTLEEARAAVTGVVDQDTYQDAATEIEAWVAENCSSG